MALLHPNKTINIESEEENVISGLNIVKEESLDGIENIRETTMKCDKIKKAYSNTYKCVLKKLKDLKQGDYDILALKVVKSNGKFGVKYIMLLQREGVSVQAYSTFSIEDTVQRLLPVHIMELIATENILLSKHDADGHIGKLTITGFGVTRDGNKFADCRFMFLANMQDWISETRRQVQESHMIGTPATADTQENQSNLTANDLPIIPPDELPPFKDILDLIVLPKKSIHTPKKIGFITRYGQARMLVELEDGVRYVAGKDLQSKQDQLHVDCKLVLEKTKICTSSGKKHFIATVVAKGDWAGIIQYSRTPILRQRKGNEDTRRVLDVSQVEHKGKKRKLVLTDDGNVYRMKASRSENEITAGCFV